MKKYVALTLSTLCVASLMSIGTAGASAEEISYDQPLPQSALPTQDRTTINLGQSKRHSVASKVIMDGTLSGYTQTRVPPPGGTKSDVTLGFASNVNFGSTQITTAVVKGQSYALWKGSKPARATSIKLTDTFWSTGVGVSVSYPNSSVGISGQTATLSNTVANTKENRHYYSGLKFHGAIFSVSQKAAGAFRFGSSTFYTYAD